MSQRSGQARGFCRPFCVLAPLLQVPTYSGMKKSTKLRPPVLAAGGIVVRETSEPLIAVVRLRKDKSWVLPKGKLKPGEDALVGARREVRKRLGMTFRSKGFSARCRTPRGA